jgi:DNA invertase Pin-like site-specific DNA recombinase
MRIALSQLAVQRCVDIWRPHLRLVFDQLQIEVGRPELDRVLDELEAGDVLVVTKLDRLARLTRDLLRGLFGSSRRRTLRTR